TGAEFTDTRGNNVDVHLDRNGNDIPDADDGSGLARPNGGALLDFSSGYAFSPTQSPLTNGNSQVAQGNAYYVTNYAHDVHYKFGFTEAAGNFQVNNYNRGGLAGDPVQVDAQDSSVPNNANFAAPPDGQQGRLQLGLFNFTIPNRDAALDNSIILHE